MLKINRNLFALAQFSNQFFQRCLVIDQRKRRCIKSFDFLSLHWDLADAIML